MSDQSAVGCLPAKVPDLAYAASVKNSESHWRLTRQKKYSLKGVVRTVSPATTIRRARKILLKAGISRVAEVTHLDRIGIPNFMSVRPREVEPGISYYNGKGTTQDDAHAGAIMEAIERHAGETCASEIVFGSYSRLRRSRRCVDPDEIVVPRLKDYSSALPLEWVAGFDLIGSCETLVPLNTVVCPYYPRRGEALFLAHTNGLASGNTLIEALCHALCEVIERDAQSISLARTRIRPAVHSLAKRKLTAVKRERTILLESVPTRALLLIGKMRRAGLQVILHDLSETAGIATIECTMVDSTCPGIPNAYAGCGAHPDARVALLRALTEAAQSRITKIQGGREDLPEILRRNEPISGQAAGEPPDAEEQIHFSDVPSWESRYVDEDVELMLDRLPKYGLDQVVAIDLTHRDVGVPVVRVVVPKAESWPVFRVHIGRATFGPRVHRELLA